MRERYKDRKTGGLARVSPSVIYDGFDIDSIRVRIKGHGGGSRLMEKILRDADKRSETLYLVVVPSGPMDEQQLRAWYQRLGFESFGSMWMRRIPPAARKPGNS
jgi:hypothetical protein